MPLRSAILGLALAVFAARAGEVSMSSIRIWSQPEVTRVIVELSGEFAFKHDRLANPPRVFFDLSDAVLQLPEARGKKYSTTQVNDRYLTKVRAAESTPGTIRLVFDLAMENADYAVSELANPSRLVVEFREGKAGKPVQATEAIPRITLDQMRDAASKSASTGKVVVPPVAKVVPSAVSSVPAAPVAVPLSGPPIDIAAPALPTAPTDRPAVTPVERKTTPGTESPAALPARRGSKSMTRALGLKLGRIVLDPGHGGHDLGTSSPSGMHEKDLVLDVAKRLGDLLSERLGSEVLYTRSDDIYVALEKRTHFANEHRADLFVSIHANSSRHSNVSGPETFFLNFTSSQDAMETASRENAPSGKTIFELQDLLQKIALNDKLTESREFAAKVQASMVSLVRKDAERTRDRGVKRAPFVVLIGAAMPSILTEIGFVTNAREEAQLRKPEYRQRVAEALYRGISQYAAGLSHFQVAQRVTQ